MRSVLPTVLLVAGLVSGPVRAAAAQATGASLAGTVHDAETGSGLVAAKVVVGQRHATSDSVGHWELHGLSAGALRLRVLRIGYAAFDTTVVLPAAGELRLDLRVKPAYFDRAMEVGEAANIAAGRTDSSALGLLKREPASLTFAGFTSRLLRTIADARDADSNTILSPASVAFALSIPLLGAQGATATELAKAIGVDGMDRAMLRTRTAAAMRSGTERKDVQLEIANAMWVDTALRLNPAFVEAVSPYRALVRSEALDAPSLVDHVNGWADSVTHGKINKVVNEPLKGGALFIANAVYFKGKWLDQFDKSATRRRDFRLATGKVVQVDGMERRGQVGYARGEHSQMVRLPYRAGRFAMYVVLPDSNISPATIEKAFVARGMPPSLTETEFRDVHLVLPRLHAKLSYDLKPALAALGIRHAFDCDEGTADFGGIGIKRASNAAAPLCIAKASQAVYLDVDEEGTEAAAVTGFEVVVTGAPPPPIQFIVDRPFLFMLRDEVTGMDLFVGTIRHP